MTKINALIIASEITKGMKSIGSRSMLTIADNIRVIDQQIQNLKNINKHINITIASGFEHDKISQYIKKYKNISILYNDKYKSTNEAESLGIYLKSVADIDNLLIVGGGTLIKKNTIMMNDLKTNKSIIFLLSGPKNNFNLGCNKSNKLEYLFYDLDYPWIECIFLNKNSIYELKNNMDKINCHQKYIFEIINNLAINSEIVPLYLNKKDVMKISNINDLIKAKQFI